MSEAARITHFQIFNDIQTLTDKAMRLGITGANIYSCNNYTSPLHCDNDAGHGLCAQIELQAYTEYDEYSFIYADYGIYMQAQSNSLWYIKSILEYIYN